MMLSKKDISLIPKGFDVIGDILIFVKFPQVLIKKEKEVGNYILKKLSNVKVVCRKTKKFSGKYRLQKLKIIAGEKRKETIYKENGCLFKLNAETCYFSPRLSTERLRISSQVISGEDVLVMFSGIAVYPIVISKKTKAKEIYGVEINPEAHKYGLENIKLNKIKNIRLYNGDVNNVFPKIKKKFDRIIMPLPKDAYKYIGLAAKKCKKNGIIHIYDFLNEEDLPNKGLEKIDKYKIKYKLIDYNKCGQIAPRKFRVCFDIKLIG